MHGHTLKHPAGLPCKRDHGSTSCFRNNNRIVRAKDGESPQSRSTVVEIGTGVGGSRAANPALAAGAFATAPVRDGGSLAGNDAPPGGRIR